MREYINIINEAATGTINKKLAAIGKQRGFEVKPGYYSSSMGYNVDSLQATRLYYMKMANRWADQNITRSDNFANGIYRNKREYDKYRSKLPADVTAYFDWHHESMQDINNVDEQRQIRSVSRDPFKLQYISNPSEAVQLAAVRKAPDAIAWIDNPSETIQLKAVKRHLDVIEYIKNPTEKVQLNVLERNIYMLEFINNSAITPGVKRYILNQLLIWAKDLKTYDDSFDGFKDLIKVIKEKKLNWPEADVIDKTVDNYTSLKESIDLNSATEKEQLLAIKINSREIANIRNPSEAVQVAAVSKNEYSLRLIKNPTESAVLAGVNKNVFIIEDIDNNLITNKVKTVVMKKILSWVNNLDSYTNELNLISMFDILDRKGIKWPELNIIKSKLSYLFDI